MFKILDQMWEQKNYIVPKENLLRSPIVANKYNGIEELNLSKLQITKNEIIYKNIYHFSINSQHVANKDFIELENDEFKLHVKKIILKS